MAQPVQPVIAEPSQSGAPSQKERKYDRQLRLWGAKGQEALERAHIALVNATAAGTETLKNLVLPGIGRFTIIDDKKVGEEDLGANFFYAEDCIGQSRAKCAAEKLMELNPDSEGTYIEESLDSLLQKESGILLTFTHFLVCSPVHSASLIKLQSLDGNVPIFLIYSVGFAAACRISVPEVAIAETHPESLVDLRLFNPWDELLEFAASKTESIDTMTDHQHGHIPYVALLLHYLQKWKEDKGSFPNSYKEKKDFIKSIKDGMRTNVPGGSEENFEEAAAAVLNNIKKHEISSYCKSVLDDPKTKITSDSEPFWVIARAVKLFVEKHGVLPLTGVLPDMKAESNTYVELQKIYRRKAQADLAEVVGFVKSGLEGIGKAAGTVSREDIETFVKNANHVRVIRMRPLEKEFSIDLPHAKVVVSELEMDPMSSMSLAVAFKAFQKFLDENGRFPGEMDESLEKDTSAVDAFARDYLSKIYGVSGKEAILEVPEYVAKWNKELVRAGGSELHNVSAMIGGIAAQEIIKVTTRQYVPANNTIVLDGIISKVAVYEL